MLNVSALEPFKNQLFSMQKQQAIWSQEHGALLKKLRENARLDVSSLAHRNTVSKSQVIQLEDGGDSSFYNPDIKYSIGKKLLKFLGHDLLDTTAAQPASLEPAKTISSEPIAPSDAVISLPTAEPTMASAPIQPRPRPPCSTPKHIAVQSSQGSFSCDFEKYGLGAVVGGYGFLCFFWPA